MKSQTAMILFTLYKALSIIFIVIGANELFFRSEGTSLYGFVIMSFGVLFTVLYSTKKRKKSMPICNFKSHLLQEILSFILSMSFGVLVLSLYYYLLNKPYSISLIMYTFCSFLIGMFVYYILCKKGEQ